MRILARHSERSEISLPSRAVCKMTSRLVLGYISRPERTA